MEIMQHKHVERKHAMLEAMQAMHGVPEEPLRTQDDLHKRPRHVDEQFI